jgi:antitoxin (DNA-binding transcriptional repressor) of toxin-antitoxin stability system
MIKPAASSNFEADALSVLLAGGEFKEQYAGQRTADGIATSAEVLSTLRQGDQQERETRRPSSREPQFYTLRELSHRTSHVIREINERDERGYLTRRGRLLAVIIPLASARLEETALAAVLARANATEGLSNAAGASTSSHEAAADLGVHYGH